MSPPSRVPGSPSERATARQLFSKDDGHEVDEVPVAGRHCPGGTMPFEYRAGLVGYLPSHVAVEANVDSPPDADVTREQRGRAFDDPVPVEEEEAL